MNASRKNGKRCRRGCRQPGNGFPMVTCGQCKQIVSKRSTIAVYPGRGKKLRVCRKACGGSKSEGQE